MKSRPIIVTQSILAGADVLAASAALTDVLPYKFAIFFVLVTKAVGVGVAFYVQSITVPLGDTAAYVDSNNDLVAGPAAGITNGQPVTVAKDRLT